MRTKSDDELRDILGLAAQEWTRRFQLNHRMLSVPFPRGQIRRLDDISGRWPYLYPDQCRNLACTIQLCDVNVWFLNTWKISLTAGSEWEWQCSLPLIAVMESLVHGYGVRCQIFKEHTKFKKAIDKLHNAKVIGNQLRGELYIQKQRRDDIHLFLKSPVGNHDDRPRRYNQAVRTLNKLECELAGSWRNQPQKNL